MRRRRGATPGPHHPSRNPTTRDATVISVIISFVVIVILHYRVEIQYVVKGDTIVLMARHGYEVAPRHPSLLQAKTSVGPSDRLSRGIRDSSDFRSRSKTGQHKFGTQLQ